MDTTKRSDNCPGVELVDDTGKACLVARIPGSTFVAAMHLSPVMDGPPALPPPRLFAVPPLRPLPAVRRLTALLLPIERTDRTAPVPALDGAKRTPRMAAVASATRPRRSSKSLSSLSYPPDRLRLALRASAAASSSWAAHRNCSAAQQLGRYSNSPESN